MLRPVTITRVLRGPVLYSPPEPEPEGISMAAAILDRTPVASFLLTADSTLLYRNAAADHLLGVSSGLSVRDGRLQLVDAWKRRDFRDRLRCVAEGRDGELYGAVSVEPAQGGRALQLVITRLAADRSTRREPHMLVMVTDPGAQVEIPAAVLRQLYDFTPAEVQIANALLGGLALEEIAERRNVSVATVRSQLKALLEKTGTKRQAALVRLLSSLAGSVPVSRDWRPDFGLAHRQVHESWKLAAAL